MSKEQPINLNISDFLKVFAVASVILQTVLSYVLTHSPQTEAMNSIGSFYRMSKYSAPMFIFAIIYNMVLKSQAESYLEFLKEKFYELVLPYVVWSSLYLYAFPSLQQRMPYETLLGFLGKVLSGDGAAHILYFRGHRSEVSGGNFYFLEKDESGPISVVSFYFLAGSPREFI